MYSCADTLAGGLPHSDIHGSTPARGSPWLFAACHVLHRLLVPRHPPNALLILDIPISARRARSHHAQKPSSGVAVSPQSQSPGTATTWTHDLLEILFSAHNRIFPDHPPTDRLRDRRRIHPTKSFTAPLNPRRPTVGAPPSQNNSPGQTSRPNSGTSRSVQRQTSRHTRPETHQNLIHIYKEQTRPPNSRPLQSARSHTQDALPEPMITPNSGHSAIQNQCQQCVDLPSLTGGPPAGRPAFIVCKQTIAAAADDAGSTAACSPRLRLQTRVVETTGIEPVTPCLQSRCSPS